MAAKTTATKPAAKASAEAPAKERSTWKWTPAQLDFLLENATTPRGELVAAFRRKFKGFTGSDTAILGRRYTLVHKARTPEAQRKALEARIEATRKQLADLEASLAKLDA